MSTENIEKFYALAYQNPALVEGLKAVTEVEAYTKLAIELGAANGCDFNAAEVAAWTAAKAAAISAGELDDQQLEAVAGGKGDPFVAIGSALNTGFQSYTYFTNPSSMTYGADNGNGGKVVSGILQIAKMLP